MEYSPFVCKEFADLIVIRVFFVLKNWIRLGRSNIRQAARNRNPIILEKFELKKFPFSGTSAWSNNESPKKSPYMNGGGILTPGLSSFFIRMNY
jgi:hypothetical protein